MQAELREVPLRDRFQLISDQFFIKTLHKVQHPIFPILEELDYTLQNSVSLCPFNKHFFPSKFFSKFRGHTNRLLRMSFPLCLFIPYESQFFQPSIDIQLGPTIYNSRSPDLVFNKLVSLEYPNYTHFYTDGSKSKILTISYGLVPNLRTPGSGWRIPSCSMTLNTVHPLPSILGGYLKKWKWALAPPSCDSKNLKSMQTKHPYPATWNPIKRWALNDIEISKSGENGIRNETFEFPLIRRN